VIFTTDKKRLRAHFAKDPALFAYHIGDLDDFFFSDCLWPAVFGERGGIDDVLLTYLGGETPTLQAFGLTARFPDLLRAYLPIAPRRFFCHYQKQYRAIFQDFACEQPLGSHLKMKLDEATFHTSVGRDQRVALSLSKGGPANEVAGVQDSCPTRLDPSHEGALHELYAVAYPDSYFTPRMLQTGRFFGYFDQGNIVAVAGVHVVSDTERIAALGNVTTHPDYRGRGLAALVTQRLTSELVSEGKAVCLNVKADNTTAIACYRKLGFVPVHEYEEALFELK
jgi:GNAT superfamily N-acetyltransferase